jgi:predicted nucleic acid-binding protein
VGESGRETSSMRDKAFLDTNVLVYLYDADAPDKQARAREILERGSAQTDLILSTQVLQEFYVTVTRKFSRHLSESEALLAMRGLRAFPTVQVDVAMIFDAVELRRAYQISFWDALIARAALAAGCSRLLTEDLQHQMRIGDLTIENPFLAN